jgi:hypothetical protein
MSDYFDLADKAIAQAYPGQRGWWGGERIPNYGILRGTIEQTIRTVLAEKDKEIVRLKGLLAELEIILFLSDAPSCHVVARTILGLEKIGESHD